MRRPPPLRLRAEPLEDRTAPATFTVTTLADASTGSLRQAILDANAAPDIPTDLDKIEFANTLTGTITLGGTQLPAITGKLTITGPGTQLAVSGNDRSRVFEVAAGATATITGLTITRGSGTDGGGILNRGALTVRGVTLAANAATGDGGGVFSRINSTSLRVEGCTFTDNRARRAGAGVSAICPATVTGSTFTGNAVLVSGNLSGMGGGIHVLGGLDLTDSMFSGNSATDGGAVSFGPAADGVLAVTRCTIVGNTAGTGGGGIYFGGSLTLADSLLETNHAGLTGGAVSTSFGTATLTATGTTFRGNTAVTYGGAWHLDPPGATTTAAATGCTFTGNSASSGGGIWSEGTLTLTGSVVSDNTATGDGGGIEARGTRTVVIGCTLTGNSGSSGGGIRGEEVLEVTDSTLSGNTAFHGGGIDFGSGVLTVTGTTLSGNAAQGSGGGIYYSGAEFLGDGIVLRGSTLSDNTAGSVGGGVYISGGAVGVTDSVFRRNTSTTSGGAVSIQSAGATPRVVAGCTFEDNVASDGGGGAINAAAGPLAVRDSTFRRNSASLGSGGAIVAGLNGGEIHSVVDCTFDDNTARLFGGGMWVGGIVTVTRSVFTGNAVTADGAGGGISGGQLTVTDSAFINNHTPVGVGLGGGIDSASLTVTNSTFAGNSAGGGGGIRIGFGGAAVVTNSTFNGNAATKPAPPPGPSSGTSPGGGAVLASAGVTLTHCTIAGNSAVAFGGGVRAESGGSVTFLSTLVAGNTAPTGPDVRGAVAAANHTLIGNGAGMGAVGSGGNNQIGTAAAPINPLLDMLAGNGGPTQTMALLPGSPALDTGPPAGTAGLPATDQRGPGFARVAGPAADIGAFEVQTVVVVVVNPATLPDGQVGDAYSQTLTAAGSAGPFTFTVSAGTLPDGLTLTTAGVLSGTPTTAVTATFTVTAADAAGPTGSRAYQLLVAPAPNTAPTITAVPDQTIPESGSTGALGFTVGDGQTAAASLVVTGTSSNTGLVPNANVTITPGAGGARTVTVMPIPGASGTTTITLAVSDGTLTTTDTFDVTVTPNTAPTITAVPDQTIPESGSTGALGFTVGDGQTAAASLVVTGTSSNTGLVPNANVTITPGAGGARTVTVTPIPGASGTTTITLAVSDGTLTTTATFDVTVTPNTRPTITDVSDQTIPANGSTGALGFTVGDAQTAAATLTVSGTSSNPALVLNGNVVVTPGAGGARTVTVTPIPGASGTTTITLTVSDGALTATDTFDVTVTPPPVPPVPPPPVAARSLVVSTTGGTARVFDADAAGRFGAAAATLNPFNRATGNVRTAQADVDGDGTPDVVAVTGSGTALRLAVVSGADRRTLLVAPFDPFGGNFTGGGFVAAADLDHDGRAEFLVTPDQGGGPRVTIFSFTAAGAAPAQRANFFGIDDANFRGGARAALGDVNGDGTPDLAVGAGFLGGPRVALFSGTTLLGGAPGRLINDFFAFPGSDATTLRNGVFVAAGDVDGDGRAELIFGGGPGGAPRVFVLSGAVVATGNVSGAQAAPVSNFFVANNSSDRGGVRVAAADADGDGRADVYAGSGERAVGRVRVYLGKNFTPGGGEPGAFQDVDVSAGAALTNGVYVG